MNLIIKRFLSIFTTAVIITTLAVPMSKAFAATTNVTPLAKVSFTFDDGLNSAVTQAAPTLAKYGFTGTDYIISNCIGMITIPNTCHANNDASYMNWTQVSQLQNTYQWEIGSHTATHPYLATSDSTDGQPNVLTSAQVSQELASSKSTLAANGITATDFATPYGDYNNAVMAQIAKEYASHRGFADTGYNPWPNNEYLIRDQPVQAGYLYQRLKDTSIMRLRIINGWY